MIEVGKESITGLAKAIGISRVFLSRALRGKEHVRPETLAKLAEQLGIPGNRLLKREVKPCQKSHPVK